MFRRQLSVNIKDLDLQISELREELEGLEQDNKYESIMDKLKNLTELRVALAKSLKENESSDAVNEMDKQIEELTVMLEHIGKNDVYSDKLKTLEELTKIRCQLAENRQNISIKPAVVSGIFGIVSVAMVLRYEETEIITSKAFNMATSMIRGNR